MSTIYRTNDGENFRGEWEAEEHAENLANSEALQRKWDAEEKAAWWASLSPEEKRRWNIFVRTTMAIIAIGIIFAIFVVFPAPFYAAASKATGFLGMKSLSETTAMSAVRNTKTSNLIGKGDKMSDETLVENKAAIEAFINSDKSYRMDGVVQYAVGGRLNNKKLYAKFDMWYNHETGVVKFHFKQFYSQEDHALQNIFGSDSHPFRYEKRTYYVVQENRQTYLLTENKNKQREVYKFEKGIFLFDFMDALQTHKLINTDFLNNPETERYHYRGGEFYKLRSAKRTNIILSEHSGSELRTFNNQPMYYYTSGKNNARVEYEFTVNFYYDKIPNDKPSVAEWK